NDANAGDDDRLQEVRDRFLAVSVGVGGVFASVGADGVTYVVGVMLQGLSNASEAIINRMSVGVLLSPYAPVVLQQHNQRPNARAGDAVCRHSGRNRAGRRALGISLCQPLR